MIAFLVNAIPTVEMAAVPSAASVTLQCPFPYAAVVPVVILCPV